MCAVIVIVALAASALPGSAQQRIDSRAGRADAVSARARQMSGPGALGVETLGGALGSAVGFGAVVLLHDRNACGENLSCTLGNAAAAVVAGTVGAAGGAYIAGRIAGTEPSGLGAVVGAAAGIGAIAGIDHALTGSDDSTRYLAFALAQGILAAAGSRIGALLR